MSRYDLTDFEWRVIAPLLPNKPRGVPRVDDRRVLNGIFWVLRCGAPWRDLPERYGPRTTCYNRFVRWRKAGVWDRMMDAITSAHDGDIQMIDSTSIRAHQQAATAKRGIEIIASVAPEAASRPKSMRSSTGKAFRSDWALPLDKAMTSKLPVICSTMSVLEQSCWRTRLMTPIAFEQLSAKKERSPISRPSPTAGRNLTSAHGFTVSGT